MRGPKWLDGLRGRWRQVADRRSRDRGQDDLVSYLYVTRLEERRVLNAGAVSQLVVDAGESANDGQADTFHIEQDGDHIQISVNDDIVGRTRADELESITINGSLDDDVVTAELAEGGALDGLEIRIVGGDGGSDVLRLVADQDFDSVTHQVENGTSRVTIGDASASIIFAGMETVYDELTADARTFEFTSDSQHVTLDDFAASDDTLSRLEVSDADPEVGEAWTVIFTSPTNELHIDTSATVGDGSDRVDIQGLDASFTADLFIEGGTDDTLLISGRTEIGGGDVSLFGGEIFVEDTIVTHEATVRLTAADEITIAEHATVESDYGEVILTAPDITHDGQILAEGGFVAIDSGDAGVTLVRGIIDVSTDDDGQEAGTVHILGMDVGLLDESRIDASGVAGGGTILIGGDYQGKNPSVQNASRTFVASDATIRADATSMGNGGRVIIWSDGWTKFYGSISAGWERWR